MKHLYNQDLRRPNMGLLTHNPNAGDHIQILHFTFPE